MFDPRRVGPYETEAQAMAEPMPVEVRMLDSDHRIPAGQMGDRSAQIALRHLLEACATADVEVGVHDRRVLSWLTRWEDDVGQVIIGLIARAHAGGAAWALEQLLTGNEWVLYGPCPAGGCHAARGRPCVNRRTGAPVTAAHPNRPKMSAVDRDGQKFAGEAGRRG
jgi:hypothetical protein